jgi:hypothetical protein
VVVIVVAIVIASAVSVNHVSNNLKTTGNAAGAAPAAKYSVGQTAKTGGFTITVYNFTDPYQPSDPMFIAPSGQHFVTVDVQVTNPTSSTETFSSLGGFHLLDSANRQYDETIIVDLSPSAPDGPIPPGGSIRGFVGFQVPDGTTGLGFRAQGNFTATGAVWKLS